MPMAQKGTTKALEELGELSQELAKLQALYLDIDKSHWDGKGAMRRRIENEAADVMASIQFLINKFGLDINYMMQRADKKLALFEEWDKDDES